MSDNRSDLSMDEILSSIKKIIADEDRAKPIAPRKINRSKAAAHQESDTDMADQEQVLELTQTADLEDDTENLLDDNKAQNLARSFSTLQTLSEPGAEPKIVRSGETSLEELTRDLMRPMLKEWLDSNLPSIVESMVEREIARITKKG